MTLLKVDNITSLDTDRMAEIQKKRSEEKAANNFKESYNLYVRLLNDMFEPEGYFDVRELRKLYRWIHYTKVDETTKEWNFVYSYHVEVIASLPEDVIDLIARSVLKILNDPYIQYNDSTNKFSWDKKLEKATPESVETQPFTVQEALVADPVLEKKQHAFMTWLFKKNR